MIVCQKKGSVCVVSFDEDEQLRDPEPLREYIRELLDQGQNQILIDMANVTYISSSVLGVLITTYRELQSSNGTIKLVNVQPSVSNLFSITRIDRIIEMFNDIDTALKSFE